MAIKLTQVVQCFVTIASSLAWCLVHLRVKIRDIVDSSSKLYIMLSLGIDVFYELSNVDSASYL